jgi:hypothetical protein
VFKFHIKATEADGRILFEEDSIVTRGELIKTMQSVVEPMIQYGLPFEISMNVLPLNLGNPAPLARERLTG